MVTIAKMPEVVVTADNDLQNGDRLAQGEFHRRYCARPDIKKAELVLGLVFLMAFPLHVEHARPHGRLLYWLWNYGDAHPELGLDILDNVAVILSEDTEVQPDITVRRTGLAPDGTRVDRCVYGAPSLVVEVAATSKILDLGLKLEAYEAAGVEEYLVYRSLERGVDWFARTLGKFQRIPSREDGSLESRRYPGLVFPEALV